MAAMRKLFLSCFLKVIIHKYCGQLFIIEFKTAGPAVASMQVIEGVEYDLVVSTHSCISLLETLTVCCVRCMLRVAVMCVCRCTSTSATMQQFC